MSRFFSSAALSIFVTVMSLSAGDSTTVASAPDSVGSIKNRQSPINDSAALPSFTMKEVAAFDGSDGKPAYVAVEGVVYDMSSVKAWKKGKHHGHTAGFDLTEMLIKKSPHGAKVLKKLKVVGKVVENTEKE